METLIFTTDSAKNVQPAKTEVAERDAMPVSQPKISEETKHNAEEADNELNLANVERPVDLYKAIFSDDSDDEGDIASLNNVDDQEKKAEGANMTLNRLVAGDFLESLGKELGLGVPSDTNDGPCKTNLETGGDSNNKISSGNERSGLEHQTPNILWEDKEPAVSKSTSLENVMRNVSLVTRHEGAVPLEGDVLGNTDSRRSSRSISSSGRIGNIYSDDQDGEDLSEEKDPRANRHKIRSHHRRRRSSDSDSSSDRRRHDRSRLKSDKRSSEGESRKHSIHHKHKRRRSRSRYSNHEDDRDQKDDHRRKDKKYRDGASGAAYSKHDDYRKYR